MKCKVVIQKHSITKTYWWSLWRRFSTLQAWAIVASQDGFKTPEEALADWDGMAAGIGVAKVKVIEED